jgi:hypothetical protein
MYWSAWAGLIHGLNTPRKNTEAIAAIENGFTSQLTNNVMTSPRGWRPTLRIAPKSTCGPPIDQGPIHTGVVLVVADAEVGADGRAFSGVRIR